MDNVDLVYLGDSPWIGAFVFLEIVVRKLQWMEMSFASWGV